MRRISSASAVQVALALGTATVLMAQGLDMRAWRRSAPPIRTVSRVAGVARLPAGGLAAGAERHARSTRPIDVR